MEKGGVLPWKLSNAPADACVLAAKAGLEKTQQRKESEWKDWSDGAAPQRDCRSPGWVEAPRWRKGGSNSGLAGEGTSTRLDGCRTKLLEKEGLMMPQSEP